MACNYHWREVNWRKRNSSFDKNNQCVRDLKDLCFGHRADHVSSEQKISGSVNSTPFLYNIFLDLL